MLSRLALLGDVRSPRDFIYILNTVRHFIIDRKTGRVLVDPGETLLRAGLDLREFELNIINRFNDRLYFATPSGLIVCIRESGQVNPRPLVDPTAKRFGYAPPEGIKSRRLHRFPRTKLNPKVVPSRVPTPRRRTPPTPRRKMPVTPRRRMPATPRRSTRPRLTRINPLRPTRRRRKNRRPTRMIRNECDRPDSPRHLLSVYDKTGLIELARVLARAGAELLASGGTRHALADAGITGHGSRLTSPASPKSSAAGSRRSIPRSTPASWLAANCPADLAQLERKLRTHRSRGREPLSVRSHDRTSRRDFRRWHREHRRRRPHSPACGREEPPACRRSLKLQPASKLDRFDRKARRHDTRRPPPAGRRRLRALERIRPRDRRLHEPRRRGPRRMTSRFPKGSSSAFRYAVLCDTEKTRTSKPLSTSSPKRKVVALQPRDCCTGRSSHSTTCSTSTAPCVWCGRSPVRRPAFSSTITPVAQPLPKLLPSRSSGPTKATRPAPSEASLRSTEPSTWNRLSECASPAASSKPFCAGLLPGCPRLAHDQAHLAKQRSPARRRVAARPRCRRPRGLRPAPHRGGPARPDVGLDRA